jgi:predicted nucleic acid-binding protein
MVRPGFSVDGSAIVVADTSALINLNATGCASAILEALPCRVMVTEAVLTELDQARSRGHSDADQTAKLISQGVMAIGQLGEVGQECLEGLVVGRATETLDDGEASSIALAVELSGIALVDEKKARRICGERHPTLRLACSVDILCHPTVEAALGQAEVKRAVVRSLQVARMNVAADYLEWVVQLIGSDEVEDCKSLPSSVRRSRQG